MYKLVIFDLDGTLLDTLGDLSAAGNYALERMGKPIHPKEAYKLFVGNGIPKLIERILPQDSTEQERERTFNIFNEYYSAHKSDRTVPYEGMTQLLDRLNNAGVICVCNTNKAHEFSQELLKKSYGGSIADVIGFGAGFPAKPAPDAALEFLERYSVNKAETLFVGDSNVDILTAHAAGIDGCAVLWGFRSYEELSACEPAHIAADPAELERVILGEK